MSTPDRLGGIIHTYQKFDPMNFPSPTAPPPDVVSQAFEHLLFYGNTRRLTEEELARAIRIDPSQIMGLGPSLEALMEILRERKRKILATYESEQVQEEARRTYQEQVRQVKPPAKLAQRFQRAVREEQQEIEQGKKGFLLNPKAYRIFQSKLLARIFSEIQASRTGRHQGPIVGEGAAELQQTKPYEFGDSVTHMDLPASFVNALIRDGPGIPVRLKPEDIEIHKTRNNPKCATVVLLDMSGSMRYDAQYVNVKRMGLALDGLIRTEYPGDFLQFIEMYTIAKPRHLSEIAGLMPKPVTIYDSVVRLRADMSDPKITELDLPP